MLDQVGAVYSRLLLIFSVGHLDKISCLVLLLLMRELYYFP